MSSPLPGVQEDILEKILGVHLPGLVPCAIYNESGHLGTFLIVSVSSVLEVNGIQFNSKKNKNPQQNLAGKILSRGVEVSTMSKRPKSKELVSTSDSDNSGDDRKEKKKKQKKPEPEESDEEVTVWELGKRRKVSINNFKGRLLVDIREYYETDDGTEKPGKKGISLSVDQWKKLKEIIPKVDKALT
ncbi:activated RNA polymerase II transcriptional coactivator p15-like [Rhopilema esculentum]|uniref:activated RNA polymerase II transcriptional coactivator p15-like n=1 Tax=Rhopilema esculentum TaxID=499914 RepID=UPI0031DDB24D